MFTQNLKQYRTALISIVAGPLIAIVVSGASTRAIVVHVIAPPTIVGESQLTEAINIEFSRTNGFVPLTSEDHPDRLPFPGDHFDIDSLTNWGAELGARYLMFVKVEREAIEQKKTFSIPLIVHKYQAVGLVRGEMRLVDIQRGKVLLSEPFEVETKGPRIIQAYVDDNRYDADISIPATQKSAFFREMENATASYLRKRLKFATNGR